MPACTPDLGVIPPATVSSALPLRQGGRESHHATILATHASSRRRHLDERPASPWMAFSP
jgi:hypothetical protein